ncbi:MAG: pyrroline-5-carboxylate reductase [Microscillaceae bacterium]|nr:pyrroline-5-carboxylate reductase [Microscillaceae bacterium]
MMENQKIAVIGGGNLGVAIAEGLLQSQAVAPQSLWVTRRRIQLIQYLEEKGIHLLSDNVHAVKQANIVILAVKPGKINEVLQEIKPHLDLEKHILVSVVTGVSLVDIQEQIGKNIILFRAMPNTAIAIRESMTCVSSNNATEAQQHLILTLFAYLGKAVMIGDELMAAATVLGACGIAYSLRYIRAASQGGIEIGFDAETARLIAAQMVKGAASLLLETGHHPEQEIDKVTTPQGCTIVGLNEMEHQGFSSALIKGIISSFNKIDHISQNYKS